MLISYRKGEGKIIRTAAFVAFMCLGFLLCRMVYEIPPLGSSLNASLYSASLFGTAINITIWLLVVLAIYIVLGFIGIKLLNIKKASDFLIETESELKKVSWPKRNEYISASVAIFFMLVFTVFYLLLVDKGLTTLMNATSNLLGVTVGF